MKKLTFCLLFSFLAVLTLEATQCDGTYIYFSENELPDEPPLGQPGNDPDGAVISAFANCCAGSTITTYDYDTGLSQTFLINDDGPNSSCSETQPQ